MSKYFSGKHLAKIINKKSINQSINKIMVCKHQFVPTVGTSSFPQVTEINIPFSIVFGRH